jgi:nucleoid-associated protein YgaU
MRDYRFKYSPECCSSDEEEKWRSEKLKDAALKLPRLAISYLGVWDTVGALGIPQRYKLFSWMNKKHEFHDTSLSRFVLSARHAVAIDERRKDFVPTLWDNLDELNKARDKKSDADDAPYQQVWFPGVHNSIGGGGERRGLSDQALDWVLDGARAAGLVLDGSTHSRIFELAPNYREFLESSPDTGLMYKFMTAFAADRTPGPSGLHEVSVSARRRWLEDPKNLNDKTKYRPGTLNRVANDLNALDKESYGLGPKFKGNVDHSGDVMYAVKPGDSLRAIAQAHYGNPNKYELIVQANLNKIDDPNRIYPGQLLRLPKS